MKRSDLDPLLEKLSANKQILSVLSSSMAELDAKSTRLSQLRAEIARVCEETQLEEQQQMEEFSTTTSELNTLRSRHLSPRPGDRRSPELEEDLVHLHGTLKGKVALLQDLRASSGANQTTLAGLIERKQELKQRFKKLEKLKVRQPPPVPLILQLEELEVEQSDLRKSIVDAESVEIPRLRAKIDAKRAKNRLKQGGFQNLAAEYDVVARNIETTKALIASTFVQLEAKSTELQAINLEMKGRLDVSQSARLKIEKLRSQLKDEQIAWTEKIQRKKAQIADIPKKVKLDQDAKAAQIVKRTALIEQLEKKLEEARVDLIQRQSALPIVQELTHRLEMEWVEHHGLVRGFEKAQAKTKAIREDLERTERAIAEFGARWPMKGKIKAKRGFTELESIYEEALIQNRQMALDHAALTDEIAVLEEMNVILKAGLAT
jgi:hypothetical protein